MIEINAAEMSIIAVLKIYFYYQPVSFASWSHKNENYVVNN